ncbi:hypothetical protein PR202_gb04608 [Eleusine coracana subsp. coracana]|uniref:Maternal effect embryo arrest 22 n=1 Tax=Eleusine coracana subsp. coracana TaxID=191504 RepID=A0AAV5E4Y2_ELECO|nr:hypothetical protein PR202_gb04608 [Eleusine coracana subsp. coracana]
MAAAPPEANSSQDAPAASSPAVDVARRTRPQSLLRKGKRAPFCPYPHAAFCLLWRKYQKVEQARNMLREAVRLLEIEVKTLREENSKLSKVYKEERLRGDSAESAREIESDARELLEKEIIELKAQNSTLQKTQNVCKNDNELLRISELEEENRRLKQVLGEERKKITSEKKSVDEEKRKVLEMQKILRSETQKSEEYRRVADTERKVASDWRASCERLRSEVNEVRTQLTAQIQKTEEVVKSIEAEKLKLSREKKRADTEKSLAEKNKALIEVERKKIIEEKKRADNFFAKLEDQKKLNEDLRTSIQVERKNAVDEKKRADNLFQRLEEERKRNECLQGKPRELGAVRDVVSSGKYRRQLVDRASESANVKLLKEKLKLKKEQLKHAKNVAKLDKAKNAMIRREFQRIKQDWMQLLSRFNMLDDHLSGGIEGIHALTELKQHPEMHGFEQRLLPNDPVAAPYLGLQAGMVPFGSSIPREYTSYQLPRESCTRPVSDIRGKQNSIPHKEGNDTMRKDDRALVQEALKSSLSCGTEVMDRTLAGARKRKRTKQSLESSDFLSSKHDFQHLRSKAHAATPNDVLAYKDDLLVLQHGNKIMPCVTEGDMENHRRKYLAVTDKATSIGCPAEVPSGGGNACAVKTYMEKRWTFLQTDQLNVLVSLIEDFLMNKEVVVCEKMGQKISDTNKYHKLDGEADIQFYMKAATIDQLISACILLGSICAKVDRMDIILEVSYKIVHMGKSNLSWTLLALHVFNSACDDKYLFPKSGSFLVTAIRLVVLLLECKDVSLCLASSYIQRNIPELPSCEHCPFNVDTVSVDCFISSLLEELDLCSLLRKNLANSNESIASSTHLGSSGLEINCFEPCSIFKQGKLAEDSHNCAGRIDLCYFTELISLLELFGIYMSCDWTYNNIVVRLLEILESCTCEEYAAALLVLVGQLGRFFIDDVGYEQRAVSELRNKLSLLMGPSFMKSRSVTVQFSAIGVLLVLLPLPFDKVVATQSRPLSGPFVLQASQISDWFFQLSKEHQSLARSFFS